MINAAPALEVAFVTPVKRFCANFTVEDPKNESRMPPAHLWSIKIENGKACIYLDGEKLKQHKKYEKVLRVEKSTVKGKDALLERADLSNDTIFFFKFSTRCSIVCIVRFYCFKNCFAVLLRTGS